VNAMLGEEELARLMAEAAETYDVPELDLDRPVAGGAMPWWRRQWLQGAAAVAVVAVGLAALGGLGDLGRGPFRDTGSSVEQHAGGSQDSGSLSGGTTGLAPSVPGSASGAGGGATAGVVGYSQSDAEARVVKTGEISLVVDDGKVSATVSRVQALVVGLRGFVSESQTEEAVDHPTATLRVRVPVGSFEALIEKVRGLGAKVVSQSSTGKDVTASYADTQAQIRSLKAARERYLTILSKADTIGETVTVQQKVDDVQGQIDRLEGQRRVLADQSDFGTLTVSVAEEGGQPKAFSEPSGWSSAWDDAKDGFTGGVQGIVGASGRVLLLLICAALLVALGRVGWRVVRRRLV